MPELICKFCQTPFTPSRLGTKFCRSKCRNDYRNRKVAYEQKLEEHQQTIAQTEEQLRTAKQSLEAYYEQKQVQEQRDKEEEKQERIFKQAYKKMEQLSDEQLYISIYETRIRRETDPVERVYLKDEMRFSDSQERQLVVADYRAKKKAILKEIEKRERTRLLRFPFFGKDPKEKTIKEEINLLEEKLKALKLKAIKLELPAAPLDQDKTSTIGLTKKDKQARLAAMKANKQRRELTGAEVRQMKFNTITLSGELGKFLGHLDNNMVAFALTGDSGAGKSYFSYELAKLFLDNNLRVKYYSLEEGVGQLTQDKLNTYNIGKELKVTGFATLDEIDREASSYDVIIIDSYSKISKDPEDYEILRQTHSQTLFVVIFQKTTGKTIRGGASITFNSSAIIDVQKHGEERLAVMKKSRYGTTNWVYSITNQKIVSRG